MAADRDGLHALLRRLRSVIGPARHWRAPPHACSFLKMRRGLDQSRLTAAS
jgi:hypothetical protein